MIRALPVSVLDFEETVPNELREEVARIQEMAEDGEPPVPNMVRTGGCYAPVGLPDLLILVALKRSGWRWVEISTVSEEEDD